jgi:radical SAM superfamily enzyme YgiQ (UPF0313 family)
MKEVGFRMISIAVESGDARILRIMKKGESLEAIEKAIKLACDLDYRVEIFLLIGIPGETWQDFQKTIEIAIKYPITEASFYHVLPYPNTELFRIAKDNHYLLREYHDYLNDGSQRRNTPFIATPEFPYDLRKKAFDYARRLASRHTKKTRKRHYQKNASEKFKKIGLNDTVALLLAKMYTISFIHDYLFNNRMMLKLKKILRINMIIMRQSVNNWHGKGKKNH